MMKRVLKISILVLLAGLGYFALHQAWGAQYTSVFSELEQLPLVVTSLLVIASFILAYKGFNRSGNWREYIPALVGIIIIGLVAARHWQYSNTKKAASVLIVSNKAGADHVLTFDFKKGGRFVLTEYDMFGHSEYFGKYEKVGDGIRLVSSNYDGPARLPEKGTRVRDTFYWQDFETMLVE